MVRRADLVYRRTQFGAAIVLTVGFAVVLLAALGALTGRHPAVIVGFVGWMQATLAAS